MDKVVVAESELGAALKLDDFIIDSRDDLADLFGQGGSNDNNKSTPCHLRGLGRSQGAQKTDHGAVFRKEEAKEVQDLAVIPTEADLLMMGLIIIAAASQY